MQEPTLGRAQPPTQGVKEVYWEHAVEDSPSSMPTLRISGAICLLPLYAFLAWTGTTLPLFTLT